MFKNRVTRKIIGHKRNGVTRERADCMRSFTLLYYLGDKIKDEIGEACGMYEAEEMHTGSWCGDLRGKSPLARPISRWENIRVYLQIGWEGRGQD